MIPKNATEENSIDFCMPVPEEAIELHNYRNAFGTITGRIVKMPTEPYYIVQLNNCSLGLNSKEAAEEFLFEFNNH